MVLDGYLGSLDGLGGLMETSVGTQSLGMVLLNAGCKRQVLEAAHGLRDCVCAESAQQQQP